MKKFLKNIQLLTLAGIVVGLSSCDCPEFNTEPNPDPRVREATITEFNSDFTVPSGIGADTIATPVAQYSVHTFAFPADVSSSGSLPNDNRVTGGQKAVLKEVSAVSGGENYTVQLVSDVPTNESLIGDLLIAEVINVTGAPADRRARIRFSGSLGKYLQSLNSASAGDFANYLRDAAVKAETEAFGTGAGVTQYGVPKTNGIKLTTSDIQIVEPDGNIIQPDGRFQDAMDELLNSEEATVYEIEVRIGEVYYYRARNGIEFGVLIEDIRQGSISPNLNRVTIKFAELKGPSCEPN